MSDLEMAFMYAKKELPSGWTIRVVLHPEGPWVGLYHGAQYVSFRSKHIVADAISEAVRTAQGLNVDEDTNEPDRPAVIHGKVQGNVGADTQEE